ncbi:hypothetical protein GPALN_005951 [Globodera pallida]|nr:hypothetical protein GPALN_005951 [Globodera pallida]
MSQKSIINFLSSKINLRSISSTPPPMGQEQYNTTINPNPSTSATNDEQHFSSAEEVDSDHIQLSDEYEQIIQSPLKRKKYSHNKKSKFEANYAEKFKKEFIQRSCKDEYQFFCKACDQNLKLRNAGAKAITDHVGTEKHKKNVAVLNANAPLTDFVKRKSASEEKRALAAEISMAYHIAKHKLDALFGEVAELQQTLKQFEDTRGNDQTMMEPFKKQMMDQFK